MEEFDGMESDVFAIPIQLGKIDFSGVGRKQIEECITELQSALDKSVSKHHVSAEEMIYSLTSCLSQLLNRYIEENGINPINK